MMNPTSQASPCDRSAAGSRDVVELCGRVHHDLTRLGSEHGVSHIFRQLGNEDLDPKCFDRLAEPPHTGAGRNQRIGKDQHQCGVGECNSEQSQLEYITLDLVNLTALEPPLVSERLGTHLAVAISDSVHVDECTLRKVHSPRRQHLSIVLARKLDQ